MLLTFTPYTVPFAASAVILACVLAFCLRNRREAIAFWLGATCVALILWCVGYIFELSAVTLEERLLWANVQFLVGTPVTLFWYCAMRRAVGAQPLSWYAHIFLWAICAALIAVCLVNPDDLFRGSPYLYYRGDLLLLNPDYGAVFYFVGLPFAYGLLVASLRLLRRDARRANVVRENAVYRVRDHILGVATLLPALGATFYVLRVPPFRDYNPAMALMSISALLCAYALSRYRLVAVAPVARAAVIENLLDGVIVLDREGRVADFNPAAAHILPGLGPDVVGQPSSDVFADNAMLCSAVEQRATRRPADGDELSAGEVIYAIDRPHQERRHYSVTVDEVTDRLGRGIGVAIVLRDVTRSVALLEEVQRLADTDGLTGLLARRRFFELAECELARARRHRLPVAFLILDLDDFKRVNDVYGHRAGDAVLRAVAVACRDALRGFDLIGRYGGDEFCVLLPQVDGDEGAAAAERLREVVKDLSVWHDGALVRPRVSVGVAGTEAVVDETVAGLLEAADLALYRAKAEGRDKVAVEE